MSKTVILTEDQIWNYMMCPAHYEMSRRKIIPDISQSLKGYINRVSKLFFTNLMNGTILPLEQLKKEWDKICKKHSDFIDQKKCVTGYAAIVQMFHWAERIKLRILDVMAPYALLFTGRDNQVINIQGDIPCLGINEWNKPEILVMDYGEKHTDQVRTDMNLRYTLQCYAYKKQTGKDIMIHVRNIKYAKDVFSYRTEEDFKRLKRTVADIGYSIDKKLFYPREGLGCLTCNVAGACRFWS